MANLLFNLIPNPPRSIVYVHPDITVEHCCHIMADNNIGALVVSDDENVIGIVSERDILRSCVCKGFQPEKITAADVVCSDITILEVHDTIDKAMQVITRTKRRHILVKELGKIVALISIGDVLYYLLEEKNQLIQHLENYISS